MRLAGPGSEGTTPAQPLRTPFGVNETAELVIDLIGQTRLVAP